MKLTGVLLLIAVDISTSLLDDRRLSCSCFLNKFNYRQVNIGCTRQSMLDGEAGNVTCSKDAVGAVPRGYEYFLGVGFHKLYRTSLNYEKALARCRQDGGLLAVPQSRSEAQAIAAIVKNNPAVKEALVGIRKETGKFTSVLGTPINLLGYHEWVPGQPDNNGPVGEDCVTINANGLYNDNRCDWAFAFVCQKTLLSAPPTGYRYVPQMGFYKHYTAPETYWKAKTRCLEDGGHLAVIDTDDEAAELVKFYDINNNVRESYVGVNDLDKEGVFVTETGKTLDSLGFVNWGTGEPNNNAPGGENCVTFHVAGTYNDIACGRSFPFFCEIPLPDY